MQGLCEWGGMTDEDTQSELDSGSAFNFRAYIERFDNVIPLSEFSTKTDGYSEALFLQSFPDPFLLLLTRLDEKAPKSKFITTDTDATTIRSLLDSPVYFVRKQARNVFEGMITVGRTENNDISIPWSKLSKFHAYFSKQGQDWFITDHASSNGTYINRQRLDPNKPYPLKEDSVDLSFSKSLAFFFMSPLGMFNYLSYMRRVGQ